MNYIIKMRLPRNFIKEQINIKKDGEEIKPQNAPDIIKDEKDFYYWIDEYSGYNCFIFRNLRIGNLCGYVEVPQAHPLSEKDYSEIEDEIDVHGGLTFSGKMFSDKQCFGFDCAHAFDLCPGMPGIMSSEEWQNYKDVNFVTEECQKLAKQLKDLDKSKDQERP